MALTDNQSWLYQQLSGNNIDLGNEDQFAAALNDENNRKWLYQQASGLGIDLGTEEQFTAAIAPPKEGSSFWQSVASHNPYPEMPSAKPEIKADEVVRPDDYADMTPDFNRVAPQLREREYQKWQEQQAQPNAWLTTPFQGLSDEDLAKQIEQLEQINDKPMQPYYDEFERRTGRKYDKSGNHNEGGDEFLFKQIVDAARAQELSKRGYYQAGAMRRKKIEEEVDNLFADNSETGNMVRDRLGRLQQEAIWRRQQNNGEMQQIKTVLEDLQQRAAAEAQSDPTGLDILGIQHNIDKAIATYNAPSKFGKDNGFVNWVKGMVDELSDYDTWTGGISQLVRSGNMTATINRLNNGEPITQREQLLLESLLALQRVQEAREKDMSVGYGIGQGTAQSIPFMAEMMVTAGLGAAGRRALVEFIEKKAGREMAEKWARALGGTTIRDAAGKTVLNEMGQELVLGETRTVAGKIGKELTYDVAQTAFMPSTYSGILDDRTNAILQNRNYGFLDYARSFTNSLNETAWERGGRFIDRGMAKFVPSHKIWGNNKWFGGLTDDYIASPVTETLEEIGTAATSGIRSLNPLYDDKSNEQLRREFTEMMTPEGIGKTFLTVLPMSLAGGVNKTAYYISTLDNYHASKTNVMQTLMDNGATAEEAKRIMTQIEGAHDDKEFFDKVGMVYNGLVNKYMLENPDATTEQLQAYGKNINNVLGQYLHDAAYYNQTINDINTAYDQLGDADRKKVNEALYEYLNRSVGDMYRERAKESLAPITHKNGYIYPIVLRGADGKTGHIVSGEVVVDETNPQALRITNDDIVTVRFDDGTVSQYMAKDLDLAGVPSIADEQVNQAAQQQMLTAESKMVFKPGNVVTAELQNGGKVSATVREITDNGVVADVIMPDGTRTTEVIPNATALNTLKVENVIEGDEQYVLPNSETLDVYRNADGSVTMTDEKGNQSVLDYVAFEKFIQDNQLQRVEAQPVVQAPEGEVQQPEAGNGVVIQQPAAQPTVMPDIANQTAEEYGTALVEHNNGNKERANTILQAQLKKAERELKALQQQQEREPSDPDDMAAWDEYWKKQDDMQQQVADAQAKVDKINGAIAAAQAWLSPEERAAQLQAQQEAERAAREAAARAEAERIAAEQKAEQERIAAEQAAEARKVLNGQMRQRSAEFAEKLGVTIVPFESVDELPESQQNVKDTMTALDKNKAIAAWYDPNTRSVFLNLQKITDMDDLVAKIFHEAVAHLGLKEMMNRIDKGVGFNKLLRGTWNSMSDEAKDIYAAYVYAARPSMQQGKSSKKYAELTADEKAAIRNMEDVQLGAADEYIANLAEKRANLEASDKSENANAIRKAWSELVQFFRELYVSLTGANLTVTDEDLAKLIHLSYTELKRRAAEQQAQQQVQQPEVQAEQVTTENQETTESKGLFEYFEGSLQELIEKAKQKGNELVKKVMAPVSTRLQSDLAGKGVEIDDSFKHVLDNSAIVHTFKKHGGKNEVKRGQIPIVDADFERIPDIVENYDDIDVQKGKRGEDNIVYSKTYEDGTTMYVEEKRNGRKELAAISMWKKKNPTLTDANRTETTPISDSNGISGDKGTTNNSDTQENEQENAKNLQNLSVLQDLVEKNDQNNTPQDYLRTLPDEQLDALEDILDPMRYEESDQGKVADEMHTFVVKEQARRYDMELEERRIAARKPAESEQLKRFYELHDGLRRSLMSKDGKYNEWIHEISDYLHSLAASKLRDIYKEAVRLNGVENVPGNLRDAYEHVHSVLEEMQNFDEVLAQQGNLSGTPSKPKINIRDWVADKTQVHEVLQGVYNDPSGVGVASNGHILIATPSLYDQSKSGTVVKPNGTVVDADYAKWQPVVDSARRGNQNTASVDWEAIRSFIAGIKDKMKADGHPWNKKYLDKIVFRMPDGKVIGFRLNNFIPFADAAALIDSPVLHYSGMNGMFHVENGNSVALIMPVINMTENGVDNYFYDLSNGQPMFSLVDDTKAQQFDIIQASNPMTDDVHTGIRSVDDIHTLQETLTDEKLLVTEPDWEEEDIRRAIEDNRVTIYSSYPIENGVFVTPSRMTAEDYAGGGMVYEKTVTPDKVAWIASDEGQYADTSSDHVMFALVDEEDHQQEMDEIKAKAQADGTFMQAPNGQPTNLTERQWLQVRTRAFQRMFGDWQNDPENATKVLDENGEPMVMYHGTNRRFNIFKYGDLGFHFGTYEQADEAASKAVRWNQSGRYNVMPVFLDIRKPFKVDYDPETWNDPTSSFLRQLRDENIIDKKDWDGLDYEGLSYAKMRSIREKLQAAGYDGVIYPNWFEFHTGEDYRTEFDDSFIALNSNQIKSATENNGDFSSSIDDIRFSIIDEEDTEAAKPEMGKDESRTDYAKRMSAWHQEQKAVDERVSQAEPSQEGDLFAATEQDEDYMQPRAGETRMQYVKRIAEELKRQKQNNVKPNKQNDYGTNESTETSDQGSAGIRATDGAGSNSILPSEGERGGDAGVDGVHGIGEAGSAGDIQKGARDNGQGVDAGTSGVVGRDREGDSGNGGVEEYQDPWEQGIRYSIENEYGIEEGASRMTVAEAFRALASMRMSSEAGKERREQIYGIQRLRDQLKELREASDLAEWVGENRTQVSEKTAEIEQGVRDRLKAQREEFAKSAKMITDFAKLMFRGRVFADMTDAQFSALLTNIRNASTKYDLQRNLDFIEDLVLKSYVQAAQHRFEKVRHIPTQRKNQTGVMTGIKVDAEHHEMLTTFNRWIGDDKNHTKIGAEQISSKELQLQHKLEETNDPTTRALLTAQLAGLSKAKDFITRLEELSADRTNIEDDIQDIKDRIAELSAKQYKDRNDEMKLQSLREQLDGLTQKLHDTIGDVVELYDYVSDDLSYLTAEGHMQFLERFKKEQEHTDEIIHFVNSDLQGVPTAPDAAKEGDYRSFKNSYLAPLRTFVHELRKYGVNAAGGEGYLYNYFALNCWQARSNYLKNRNERKAMLDAKAEELFGKGMTWDKVMRKYSNQLTDVTIEWLKRESKTDEAGIPEKAEPVQQTLTNGQIMYIYMCNKMSDGQTKLREMNISDEEVAALKEKLPKKLVELADWIQDVYFPTTRVRYNETNMFLFGTPMAEIPHYVPLKISQQDVTNAKADVAQGDFKTLPSNVVGSAINRTYNRNSIAIDKTDAMELVWENTKEMEQWSAYAGLIKDINILLRSKSFRNKINHMNPNNYDNFFDVARLAVEKYDPETAHADKLLKAAVGAIAASKISMRLYTAFKQTLSFISPLSEADPNFHKNYASALMHPIDNFKWAVETLPIFNERWSGRFAGDEKLEMARIENPKKQWEVIYDWLQKNLQTIGITPNAAIDAIICANMAKAQYETKLKYYSELGYSEEETQKRALWQADAIYNETQQSSEGAYISPFQRDGSFVATAMSLYQNSSMAYQRKNAEAIREFRKIWKRGEKEFVDFREKQLIRDGVDPAKAREFAERDYRRARAHAIADMAINGFVIQYVWNRGGKLLKNMLVLLPMMLAGDGDDKEKAWDEFVKEWKKDATLSWVQPVRGLPGGASLESLLSEIYDFATDEEKRKYMSRGEIAGKFASNIHPVIQDIAGFFSNLNNTMIKEDRDMLAVASSLVNMLSSYSTSIDTQTLANMIGGFDDLTRGRIRAGKITWMDIAQDIELILNAPPSQLQYTVMRYRDGETKEAYVRRINEYNKLRRYSVLTPMVSTDDMELTAKQKKEVEHNMAEGEYGYGYVKIYDEISDMHKKYKKRIKEMSPEEKEQEWASERFKAYQDIMERFHEMPNPYKEWSEPLTPGQANTIIRLDEQLERVLK